MKSFAFFAAILALAAAVPQPEKEINLRNGLVSDIVSGIIENLSNEIRELGYDPFVLEPQAAEYALPVPSVASVAGIISGLDVSGASNIVINQMSYGLLTSRLTFDVSLPEISIDIDNAEIAAVLLNSPVNAKLNGKLVIKNVGASGTVRINIGLITGITIREINIGFYLGGLESQFDTISLQGTNIARNINSFVNNNIFNAIVQSQADISELIELIAWQIINERL